ncbi:hypothetical protein B6K86_08890 [Lachnospiraceae bacterium]|nr:hypothetical protein B6K86_08890 [Lachnospiraceae bacterium]
MEWYKNKDELSKAIDFIMDFSCCYGWNAIASNKTSCCNYKKEDAAIPEGLRFAIRDYLRSLPSERRKEINRQISLLLGERFFTRESAVVKIFSRILSEGNPLDSDMRMFEYALHLQIKQRMQLLEKLA